MPFQRKYNATVRYFTTVAQKYQIYSRNFAVDSCSNQKHDLMQNGASSLISLFVLQFKSKGNLRRKSESPKGGVGGGGKGRKGMTKEGNRIE